MPVRSLLAFFVALATPIAVPCQTIWIVDTSASSVSFSVPHMVIHRVSGVFRDFAGEVRTADDSTFAGARLRSTVDARTIDTGRPQRDANLRDRDFLHSSQHPTLTLVSDDIRTSGPETFDVRGLLTIRGVTRNVEFEARVLDTPGSHSAAHARRLAATFQINRFDYGIAFEDNDFLAALSRAVPIVGDTVDIALDILLEARPGERLRKQPPRGAR